MERAEPRRRRFSTAEIICDATMSSSAPDPSSTAVAEVVRALHLAREASGAYANGLLDELPSSVAARFAGALVRGSRVQPPPADAQKFGASNE